jgi:hypothetical protein
VDNLRRLYDLYGEMRSITTVSINDQGDTLFFVFSLLP